MHILIIPSEFFDDKQKPLAGIFQKDQAELLSEKGHKIGVLAVKPAFTFYDLLYSTLKKRVGYLNQLPLYKAWIWFIRRAILPIENMLNSYQSRNINIVKYIGGYKFGVKDNSDKRADWIKIGTKAFDLYQKKNGIPDVIHAHNIIFGGMLGRYLSEKHNVPLVLTEHSSDHKIGNHSQEDRNLIEHELKRIEILSAVSPALGEVLIESYKLKPKKLEWLPNVLPNSFEKLYQSESKLDSKNITILNVGSLLPIKNQSILIEAFNLAFKDKEDIFLQIVGDGFLKEQLSTQISRFGLEQKVKLMGALERSEVLTLMSNSSFLVHTSKFETFGVVLIEALAMGKPIVSTACGGPECIINSSNGILVSPNNVESIAEGMIKMLNIYKVYNPSNLNKELINKFGEEAFYERIVNIYNKVSYDYHH